MDQAQVDQIVALGQKDGADARLNFTKNTEDIMHFFSLKTQRD